MKMDEPSMERPSRKIVSSGVLAGVVLLSLLGGLALVVRALRNANLTLNLELKNSDRAKQKY